MKIALISPKGRYIATAAAYSANRSAISTYTHHARRVGPGGAGAEFILHDEGTGDIPSISRPTSLVSQ